MRRESRRRDEREEWKTYLKNYTCLGAARGIYNSYKKEGDIWTRSGITQYPVQSTVLPFKTCITLN